MKSPRIYILIGLILILAIGTLGCNPFQPPGITPQGGYWASADFGPAVTGIEFYISGKTITDSGSPIIRGSDPEPKAMAGYYDNGSARWSLAGNISISQSKFSWNFFGKINGTFSDSTHCSGTYEFGSDSYNWTATPQTYSPSLMSESLKNVRIIKLDKH